MIITFWFLLAIIPPLLFFISIIGILKDPKQWRFFCTGYVICIAMIAYSWEPKSTPDITRYFTMLKNCSTMSLSEVNEYFGDGLFVKNFIFWIIGHLNDVHLLPAISTGTVYGISTYITCSYCEKQKKINYIPIILLIQFLALPFFSITSNIRNVWCFSLIILAAHRELCENKRNLATILLYILPCFIHSAGWILIGLRLLVGVSKKVKIIVFIVAFGITQIINWFYKYITYISDLEIRKMINIAHMYINETDSTYAISVANNFGEIVSRALAMVFSVLIVGYIFFYEKTTGKESKKFVLIFLIAASVIGFNAFTVPHYWRLFVALIIGISPIMVEFLDGIYKKLKLCRIIFSMLLLISCIKWVVQIKTTIGLVSYSQLISDSILNNVYIFILSVIRGIIAW